MEPVVLVSIVVLSIIFIVAVILLSLLCRHKFCKKLELLSIHHQNGLDSNLVDNMEEQSENPATGVELDQVCIQGRNIEEILKNSEWVEDATGLAPHCLAILKTCHMLSEKLVGMTMQGNATELSSPETMTDLVATAKRISPRVDDVVRSLYPPLDPRLLEARCTALVLSVSHLVLITKNACRLPGVLDWIDQSLADVDDHLRVLREASVNFDESSPRQQQRLLQQPQQPDTSAPHVTSQTPSASQHSHLFPAAFDERVSSASQPHIVTSSAAASPSDTHFGNEQPAVEQHGHVSSVRMVDTAVRIEYLPSVNQAAVSVNQAAVGADQAAVSVNQTAFGESPASQGHAVSNRSGLVVDVSADTDHLDGEATL